MTERQEIIRIAAKGDGITADGRYMAGAAPGDWLLADGSLERGPNYVSPPCRHFGTCGGCQLQHVGEAALGIFVTERVVHGAAGQGLVAERVAPAHLSPPGSRRRASLRAARVSGRIALGYSEGGSHRIVDLAECPVLVPELAALLGPLRKLLARRDGRVAVDIELALADQGPDVSLKGLTVEGLTQTEAMLDFARDNGLARLTLDQGYGPEALWEPLPVTITLSGVPVSLPPGAFLQATADSETALASAAREWLAPKNLAAPGVVADLFSGLGTFAFALAKQGNRVLAVEADRTAHMVCKTAAGVAQLPIQSMHRDLFRNPLLPDELNRFGAVLLDPPRAGAREQVVRLADSTVARVVYISCNPASWARDAATLVAGGYRLVELRPVGQFRWSTHVELASLFVR
jgi:23S rRNA (uracil1939-C5)-methyltransferase